MAVGFHSSLQQHSARTLAEVIGTSRVQVVKPGTQKLDPEAVMVLSTLSVDATVVLPEIQHSIVGKRYWVKRLGAGELTLTSAMASELIDTAPSVPVPAGASFRFMSINEQGVRLWVIGAEPTSIGDIENSNTVNTTTTNVLAPDGAGGVEWRGSAKAYAYARQDGEDQNDSYGPSRTRFTRASTLHASSGFSGGTSGCRVTYTSAATTNFFATFTGVWQRGSSDTLMTIQVSVNDVTVLRCRQVGVNDPREVSSLSGILAGVEQNDTIEIYIDDINQSVRSTDWALTLTEI